ncbi:galactose mutarotase [bacterium]|nr:galactose mutarotase [bacterium]
MFIDFNPQTFINPANISFQLNRKHNYFQQPKFDVFIKSINTESKTNINNFDGIKITKSNFGNLQKINDTAYLYTITNKNGVSVDLSDFGATITSIKVPDKNGKLVDITQGYDNVTPYEKSPIGHAGGTIGPVANKIDNGEFSLNGEIYKLETNKDNGKTHCHGGSEGFDVKKWRTNILNDGIEFIYDKKDMENGYPGNVQAKVIYKLDNDNNLHINYYAATDKDTLINMTNHTYFNLDGSENTQENSIYSHIVTLPNSSYITENNEISIPTGKLLKIKNTPFDFSTPHKIGDMINKESEQLKIAGGFDHNYTIDNYDGKTLKNIAIVKSPKTGIVLNVSTNLPGFQFYSANHLGKKAQPAGKSGSRYEKRSALCIEPQFFPNAINTETFKEKGILHKGEVYERKIIYSFSTENNP